MKTIAIGTVAMLSLTGALHAKNGERKGGDGQLFAKLDANGDDVVSKQEWLNGPAKKIKADARFAQLDKDGDDALDQNEWSAVRGGKGNRNRNRGQGGAQGRNGAGKRGAGDGKAGGRR